MTIDEIVTDILKKEDEQLAKAFTMVISSLLLSKGIQPIIIKSEDTWNPNDDVNKRIISKEFLATFDLDTSNHDAQVRAEVIDEIYAKVKTRMDLLKEQSQGRRNGKTHAMYCMQALEYMIEVVRELKEQKNDD